VGVCRGWAIVRLALGYACWPARMPHDGVFWRQPECTARHWRHRYLESRPSRTCKACRQRPRTYTHTPLAPRRTHADPQTQTHTRPPTRRRTYARPPADAHTPARPQTHTRPPTRRRTHARQPADADAHPPARRRRRRRTVSHRQQLARAADAPLCQDIDGGEGAVEDAVVYGQRKQLRVQADCLEQPRGKQHGNRDDDGQHRE
jgi:hypothetical protein